MPSLRTASDTNNSCAGIAVMECKTWSQQDASHWRGLCTNSFYSEGITGAKQCVVCVIPVDPPDPCIVCDPPAPKIYRVTISGYAHPELDASAYYREFLVYNTSACRWESKEQELLMRRVPGVFPAVYEVTDPSTVATSYGETYSKQYPRVALTIDNLLGTVRWGVELKWLTIYFTTPGLAFIVNTGTASGTSSSLSCLKPGSGTKNGWISSVDQTFFTSGQRSNQFDMSLASYAARGITWTFSVRPF